MFFGFGLLAPHCLRSLISTSTASVKPRLRDDGNGKKFYTCCRPANGYDVPAGNVLHLVKVSHRWIAIHADPSATFSQVIQQDTGMMAFSTDEDILIEGPHTWLVLGFAATLTLRC